MNKLEARIILLEDALIEAHNSISFLKECVEDPSRTEMMYPAEIEDDLLAIERLVKVPEPCHHGRFDDACPRCRDMAKRAEMVKEAEETIRKESKQES